MATPDYIVSLSEQAFFTVIVSALEAYEIRHLAESGEDDEHEPVETYGNLWGYEAKTVRKERVFHVSLADVDTSAERDWDSVTPKDETFLLKADLVDWLRPELEYLGDFHTHPYGNDPKDPVKSTRQLEKEKRYEFSPEDFDYVRSLKPSKKKTYRIGLVATIFRGSQEKRRKRGYISDENGSCIRFSYKDFTIWLQCYVFDKQKRAEDAKVALLCPAIGFHPGDIDD
jgi:hypothetical protein